MKNIRNMEDIIREYVENLVELADKSLKLYDQFAEEFALDEDTAERIQDITRDICDGSRSDIAELTEEIANEVALDEYEEDEEKDIEE